MTCITEISAETGTRGEQAVAALTGLGVLGRRLDASSWEISLPSDQVSTGRVRIEDGTIRFEMPLVGSRWPTDGLWEILNRNALAGPGVRMGLSTGRRIVLIGEVAIDSVSDIEGQVRRLLNDLTALDGPMNEDIADTVIDPAALCEEAGWEFTRRDEALIVRLEANRYGAGMKPAAIPYLAIVTVRSGMLRCVAELVRDEGLPPEPNCAAVATLLLQVATEVRLVRPVNLAGNQTRLGFESLLSSNSAQELRQTLSALSIAARLCGPEAAALFRDADLATEFLRIRLPDLVGPGFQKCFD